MPNRRATARASSMAETPQHALKASSGSGSQSGQRFIVKPTTSCPSATINAAATALSTPPLIATAHFPIHDPPATTSVWTIRRDPCKPRIPRRLCSEVPAPTPYDSSPRAPRTPAREPRLLLHPSSSLRRVVLETPPPRAQPPAHLRLKSLLTRRIVDASGDAVWKVLLRDEPSGMIVGILVVLPVAELPNHLRVAGIAQVHGDRTRLALVDITHRSADRPDYRITLGRGGDVDRRFRHRNLRFRQSYELDRVGCGSRYHQRHRIRHPHIFGCVHDHTPGDVPRVFARCDHSRQPVDGGIGIRSPHALNECRDVVVVRVTLPVVDQRAALDDFLDRLYGDAAHTGRVGWRGHRRHLDRV